MNQAAPHMVQNHGLSLRKQFSLDVLVGLSASQKFLPPKYFYDDRGSELFQRISECAEYYLTNCELDVLQKRGAEIIAALAGDAIDVVEFGAGDGRKTRILLDLLNQAGKSVSYMPVDISESAVDGLVDSIRKDYPEVDVVGFVGEYFDGLRQLDLGTAERPRLVLFLGSNIGNFEHRDAMRFLRALRDNLRDGDYLLVGFDLKKDVDVMMAAYNDKEGLTREFNINVLRRINEELGGQIPLDKFMHYGFYNPARGAMESYLVSCVAQDVQIASLNRKFHFDAFEAIHMEYSCKYLEKDVHHMAEAAGFDVVENWKCSKGWFLDSLWRARNGA